MAWSCSACAGENPDEMRFCGHCGAARDAGGAPSTRDAGSEVTEALRSFVSEQVAERIVEGGGMPEERRLVTALFADISGFTPLADRLDPEELLEVIDPVVTALSSIVARYEGYVEKYAGDALLALFGAPVSHDDDAERALRVANDMHAELAQMRESLPEDAQGLTLHVGVNSGHGIARILGSEARTDYAVLGDAVILAQRLESAAPSGETYVSDATYRLTRSRFEFEDVGELTLKGKAQTVRAWRLVCERAEEERSETRLVGRTDELRVLKAQLDELIAGQGFVASIVGEPGVGKTRLTAALEQHATDSGVQWLQGRCISYGGALSYWPFIELLRRQARLTLDQPASDAGELGASVPPAAAPFFAQLLGGTVHGSVSELEPEAFRRGLHAAFTEWLRSRAADGPLVVALEDVHWVDEASLALTSELLERLSGERVGFVLNGRPEAEAALGELQAAERFEISLGPLREQEIDVMVAGLLEAEPPAALISLLRERTGGNPFFVEEVVRALQDDGGLIRETGGWRMRPGWTADEVPPTVEEVLSARIDLLPRRAATVLQTAAVVGRRQRRFLLEAVVGAAELRVSLEQLLASHLLEPTLEDEEEAFVFRHALVVDVAYARLLRKHRRELHLQVAEAAEELYGAGDETIGLLARHLYLGGGGPKAIEYLVRAGDRARRLFANEEAIVHLARAEELAPDRTDVRLRLADVHELVGDYEQARLLYMRARNESGAVEAWTGLAAVLRKQGGYAEALEVIEHAFRTDALASADLRPIWLERARTLVVAGHVEEAIDAAHAGLASSAERDLGAGRLLAQLAFAEEVAGRFDDALRHGLEARRVFEREPGGLRDLATTLRVVGGVQRELQRFEESAATLREGLAVAERVGSVEELGGCLINLGLAEVMLGHVEEAIAIERRAIEEFERIGHGSGRVTAYFNIAEMLIESGDYAQALDFGSQALALGREIDHSLAVGAALETIALARLRREEFAEAAARAEEAAELSLEIGALPRAKRCFELAAEAAGNAGEQQRARAFMARARSLE